VIKIIKKLQDAQNDILNIMAPIAETEKVTLMEAFERIAAGDATAGFCVPPFDTSAMDGFAVKSADFSDAASLKNGLKLDIIGELAAGATLKFHVTSGKAVKIMTGAPLPEGADAILMKELCEETKTENEWHLKTVSPIRAGQHVRTVGTDFKKGDVIIPRGSFLNPAAIGLLASAAIAEILVYKTPVVAVLSTGDELIDPLEPAAREKGFVPGPGKIMNSNLYLLASLLRSSGARPHLLGMAKDTPEGISRKILEGSGAADIIITTGGASVGSYDYIPEALKLAGFEVNIWKMNMKPGRPFIFGIKNENQRMKMVFGLPGNPASSMVSFLKIIRPVIYKLCGRAAPLETLRVKGAINSEVRLDPERLTFLRARIYEDGGRTMIDVPKKQDSNILSSALRLNCLAEIPSGKGTLPEGSEVFAQII